MNALHPGTHTTRGILWRFTLVCIGLVLIGAIASGCEFGDGTACSSNSDCGDDYYCAPCRKCVDKTNVDSLRFWCGEPDSGADHHPVPDAGGEEVEPDDYCGDYYDRGISEEQTWRCQEAQIFMCHDRGHEARRRCHELWITTPEGDLCPYCDTVGEEFELDDYCGDYDDRGIQDEMASLYCQDVQAVVCEGSFEGAEIICHELGDLSEEASKCPYCDIFGE